MLKKLDRLFCYVRLHRWAKWKHEFRDDGWIIVSNSERHCQVCGKIEKHQGHSILF